MGTDLDATGSDVIAPDDRTGEVTLVFSLGAARRLADPEAAVAAARAWSRHVGIVANDADAVGRFVTETGIDNDYALRNWDKWGTLGDIEAATDAPRAVFVGASAADRRVATSVGFEYVPVDEAAAKAGWTLSEPERAKHDAGMLGRLWRAVTGRLR